MAVSRSYPMKVVVRDLDAPFEDSPVEYIKWVCKSLGIFTGRDANKTAITLFRVIVEKSECNYGISSTELAEELCMSRGAVINQLNKLIECGLIRKSGRNYTLRGGNLTRTMMEIRGDFDRLFERLEKAETYMDNCFGFPKENKIYKTL
ncbi:MAG: hypothetical protein APG12_00602 [Candidatus Methanofastidiosum methylothiophilum]|uniref:HTH arsR-type domain-containing protein n=1 Tax=Candidatus Methanofastidiosum methylothiophilum TaxID=1705564 RepID=A0A150ILD5_9EURY|nr:MAG: hypothetical protein APG10_00551 [Candidatus Methanofastidiosum methylthiophilus]KYC48000.1 MAG: hypothetical protein APG11_00670 [Candidatus Methanofastidiosum methylthiophilus]KYC50690.1 MAG: hypothetical protein APG12_00602 [Candidatus Methanofastidiosum methylthiophilus]